MKNRYLDFLCEIVGRTYEYSLLLEHLHRIEFYSLVPNDDNRGVDGEALRELYLDEVGPQGVSPLRFLAEDEVPNGPCTVLEMLVGVAQRLEIDLFGSRFERSVGEWFWVLIDNLGLEWCDNHGWNTENRASEVAKKVEILLERRYSTDGNGGLFPLKWAQKDQRRVEIWCQMSFWINENCPI